MQFLKKPQFISIAFAVFFIVLLLLLPRVQDPEKEAAKVTGESQVSTDILSSSLNNLSEGEMVVYESLQKNIETAPGPIESIQWRDSLSRFWEDRDELLLSAQELEGIANILKDKPSQFIAADAYFKAYQEGEESLKKKALESAVVQYQAVLESDPEDLEAMTSLGVCYVEGASILNQPPMKGIGLLKAVLEKDPENINALVNLGYFSTKSGQYELAVKRFQKILEIDPDFADAYLYLADVYIQLNDREKAVEYLEQYKRFIQNPSALKKFEEYIENIKENRT